MNLHEITKANFSHIQEKFSAAQNFKNSSYNQRVNLWEKGNHARLYVPRNAYEQCGYIDLHTGEVHASRPGNVNTLEEVRDYIVGLDAPEPEPQAEVAEVIPEATAEAETIPNAELTPEAEAIRQHVQWFADNRGNWWERRFPLMLRKRLIKDGLIPSKIGDMDKQEAIAALDVELRRVGLHELCSK